MTGHYPMHLQQPPAPSQYHSANRRSPSVNTFASVSSSGMVPPAAYRTSPTQDLHRSGSNRSGEYAPTSYVALLRKQKATVWSERAQPEDPRMAAAQRAAKMRANLEVVGPGGPGGAGSSSSTTLYNTSSGVVVAGRTTTGLSSAGGKVAAKIRHHGKPGVVGYSPDSNFGVPLRLSATEVEGEDSDDEDGVSAAAAAAAASGSGGSALGMRGHHRRTGSSGRSSTGSGRRQGGSTPTGGLTYRTSGRLGSMGSNGPRRWSPGATPERSGSLVEEDVITSRMSGLGLASVDDETASFSATTLGGTTAGGGKTGSIGSGSSAERADNVPDLASGPARGAANSAANAAALAQREKSGKNVDELKRRGSVDERTMTLTGSAGRLFIANPD